MSAVCWIVGAGDFWPPAFTPRPGDFVIAADGGLAHLQRIGAKADLALGDFDSLGHVPKCENVLTYPPEKDDTDMMLAVKEGLRRGYGRFALLGGLGGRLGHTLANVQALMYLAKHGARGLLIGERETVTAVTDGEIRFSSAHTGYISVFCLDAPAKGVTLRGLKYPLEDAVLTSSVALGVSNEFTGAEAVVSVSSGTLVIVWSDGRLEEVLRS